MTETYCETTGTTARKAGVLPETVRAYADLGLLEFVRIANGMRMFRPDAAERVRKIRAERMARRGGSRRPA